MGIRCNFSAPTIILASLSARSHMRTTVVLYLALTDTDIPLRFLTRTVVL